MKYASPTVGLDLAMKDGSVSANSPAPNIPAFCKACARVSASFSAFLLEEAPPVGAKKSLRLPCVWSGGVGVAGELDGIKVWSNASSKLETFLCPFGAMLLGVKKGKMTRQNKAR